jgi:hypothetical protein
LLAALVGVGKVIIAALAAAVVQEAYYKVQFL